MQRKLQPIIVTMIATSLDFAKLTRSAIEQISQMNPSQHIVLVEVEGQFRQWHSDDHSWGRTPIRHQLTPDEIETATGQLDHGGC